jgi:hypothetical protein
MLAGVRFLLLPSLMVVFFIGASLPLQAQINGVPPSVTSFGFGGSANPTPGVRASVTSLGPNGFSNTWSAFGTCCANFFLPTNPNQSVFPGHRRRHRDKDKDKDHADSLVGIVEPAYIPYPAPYAQDADDDSPDVDYVHGPISPNADPRAKRAADRDLGSKASDALEPAEPVAAQPSTVLVFKDGHKSDVLNYAIVGDTLFDFAAGRSRKILIADLDVPATRKANDDRGVDFQIPTTARQ